MKCKRCNTALTDENWYKIDQKAVFQICKECRKKEKYEKSQLFIYNAF